MILYIGNRNRGKSWNVNGDLSECVHKIANVKAYDSSIAEFIMTINS
jgi:hypothetical protein